MRLKPKAAGSNSSKPGVGKIFFFWGVFLASSRWFRPSAWRPGRLGAQRISQPLGRQDCEDGVDPRWSLPTPARGITSTLLERPAPPLPSGWQRGSRPGVCSPRDGNGGSSMLSPGLSTEVQGLGGLSGDAALHRVQMRQARWRVHQPGCRHHEPLASFQIPGRSGSTLGSSAPRGWRRSLNRATGRSTLSSSPAAWLSAGQAADKSHHTRLSRGVNDAARSGSWAVGSMPSLAAIASAAAEADCAMSAPGGRVSRAITCTRRSHTS